MSDSSQDNGVPQEIAPNEQPSPTGDLLTEKTAQDSPKVEPEETKETPKGRSDLLEYMMRDDGSVVCKLCGEILQSRTHWYRHKYKVHVIHPLSPAPLFQCEHCLVYFKSRKGYIGHIASRHSDILSDASPVLTNMQTEDKKETSTDIQSEPTQTYPSPEVKEAPDPELAIPKSSVPNYQTAAIKQSLTKASDTKKQTKKDPRTKDWVEKRSQEEKLVADIISRVRRECEAQGSGGAARRGYSRRTTVMHT